MIESVQRLYHIYTLYFKQRFLLKTHTIKAYSWATEAAVHKSLSFITAKETFDNPLAVITIRM